VRQVQAAEVAADDRRARADPQRDRLATPPDVGELSSERSSVSVSYSQASSLPERKLYSVDRRAYSTASETNDPDSPIPSNVTAMSSVPASRLSRRPRRSPTYPVGISPTSVVRL
jgi:hypothetical protein